MITPPTNSADNTIRRWLRSSNGSMDIQECNGRPLSWLDDGDSLAFIRKSDPQLGGTYLIFDTSRNRALTCHQGRLRLETISLDEKHISEQAQWLCTERNGFKGFKNVAEGGFLGHDLWWDFHAKASSHSLWESFTIARREGGLYWLQILHWWTQWQVSSRDDGSGVFAEKDKGTLWEFVKIVGL